jgi:hypothetical protein
MTVAPKDSLMAPANDITGRRQPGAMDRAEGQDAIVGGDQRLHEPDGA